MDGTETTVGDMPDISQKKEILEGQTNKKLQEHEPLYQFIDAEGHLKERSEESMPSTYGTRNH